MVGSDGGRSAPTNGALALKEVAHVGQKGTPFTHIAQACFMPTLSTLTKQYRAVQMHTGSSSTHPPACGWPPPAQRPVPPARHVVPPAQPPARRMYRHPYRL